MTPWENWDPPRIGDTQTATLPQTRAAWSFLPSRAGRRAEEPKLAAGLKVVEGSRRALLDPQVARVGRPRPATEPGLNRSAEADVSVALRRHERMFPGL